MDRLLGLDDRRQIASAHVLDDCFRVPGTSIRFGLGRFNTQEEVDYVTNRVIEVVQRLRELSPLYEMAKEGIDISKMNWGASAGH